MNLETYLTFLFAIQIVAFTPGPVWFHLFNNLSQQQNNKVPLIIFGNALGLITHITLAYLGLTILIQNSVFAYNLIKILGGMYLLYLAYKALTRKSMLPDLPTENKQVKKRSAVKIIVEAYGINLFNPKVIAFILAFLPQFINTKADDVGLQYAVYGGTYVINASIFLFLLARFAFKVQNKTKKSKLWHTCLRYCSGSVLGYFGIKILSGVFTSYKRS